MIVPKKTNEEIKHQEEHGGMIYKYDLPVVNTAIQFKQQLITVEKEQENTSLENLFTTLEIDKETSYESFIIKLNQKFNNEVDMYGDIKKAGESNLKVNYLDIKQHFRFSSLVSQFPLRLLMMK